MQPVTLSQALCSPFVSEPYKLKNLTNNHGQTILRSCSWDFIKQSKVSLKSDCQNLFCIQNFYYESKILLKKRQLKFPHSLCLCFCHSDPNCCITRLEINKWLLKYLSNYNLCYLKPDLRFSESAKLSLPLHRDMKHNSGTSKYG